MIKDVGPIILENERLKAAIREHLREEGYIVNDETLEWWIEQHQPVMAVTMKGKPTDPDDAA